MKKLLGTCTKNVHFSFNNDIYIQIDGVTMGLPLGPVISNISIVFIESVLLPKLNGHVKRRRHFVDDTFAYIKRSLIEYVLFVLSSFHDNIKFTYEQENNYRLPFLEVLFIRNFEKINTTTFRKDTHNDLYLHWD